MSATTRADRLVFVDRLMAKSWLSGAVKTFDKLACTALDAVDFSWEIIKDPVSEAVEFVAFSSLGQFTIGCLETGVDITANVLDTVLPVKEESKVKIRKGNPDKELAGELSVRPGTVDAKKKTITRDRKSDRVRPINTASTFLVLTLRNLQSWLNSLKIDPYDDLCGHCEKRRKVTATRRLGPLHGLVHLSVGAVTAPLNLVGLNVTWDVLKCAVTVSGNEHLDKSPVRPKSATEKRKFELMSSSDEEDIHAHTFHDDLADYKSDEDADYALPEKDDSTDSDEYAEGETESDVSIEATPSPVKARRAKKGVKISTDKPDENTPQNNQKNEADKKKSGNKENKKATEKPKDHQLNGSEGDKKGGKSDVVNGQKTGKATDNTDGKKSSNTDGKKSSSSPMPPRSPLRKILGV